jgi:phage repressor protein C with HTH and peptisase S24 domain
VINPTTRRKMMGWATVYIAKLQQGETVRFRPKGNSMTGLVNSGDLVTVEPRKDRHPEKGDIVLCKVMGNQYLHLVKGVDGNRVQIGNNRGGINGWTSLAQIYGYCTAVEK